MSNCSRDPSKEVSITVYCECGRPMKITVGKGKMDEMQGSQLLQNPDVQFDTPEIEKAPVSPNAGIHEKRRQTYHPKGSTP